MNYEGLFSTNMPAPVTTHPGLQADTKYVFSVTYTDPENLPYETMCAALSEALVQDGHSLARYPVPQGHEGMRSLIADGLMRERGLDVDVGSVFLSAGAGGAIKVIVDAFIDPGDVVLVEEFTYLGTLTMLLERRAQVVHVPCGDQGMDTDALEETIKGLVAAGTRPKLIVTISVFQNPMGMTLSAERRAHMLELSHRYGIPVLENESYADFRIDGPPLPRSLAGMDGLDSVMYVSAYTKLLGCGLRLGFGAVPEQVMKTLAALKFGGSTSHLSAMAAYEFLKDHKEEHVRSVAASLGAKRNAMLAALDEHFPPGCTWTRPHGGMMVWVRLPEGADTWAALDRAVEADVKYNPGAVFRAARDRGNHLRLTYSHNSVEEIHEGVAILADVFDRQGLFDS